MQQAVIRDVVSNDVSTVLHFIKELADYEKLLHEVVATEDLLQEALFGDEPSAHAVLTEIDGEAVGFALYFYNFSTFMARPGLYLEDIYIKPAYRNRGLGKQLFKHLAEKAVAKNCCRMTWWVLNWNDPSIEFYKKLGAIPKDEFTTFWLQDAALADLASA